MKNPDLSLSAQRGWRGRMPRVIVLALLCLMGVALVAAPGCDSKPKVVAPPPAVAPPPTFTGPSFLRGTIGSMVGLRPGSERHLLVSNYGLVVFPPGTGTGSAEVPPHLRQRLINAMRRRGLGSPSIRAQLPPELAPFLSMSPERFLDSHDTTIVAVQGLIPPGATVGERFDVLVSAIDSQTTSLTGGTLWTLDLGVEGTSYDFVRPLAEAYGPIYVSPFDDRPIVEQQQDFRRQGVVVLGGEVKQPRNIELALNQPSWSRSRLIANRINERFGRSSDRRPIANAVSDMRVDLHIPRRWAHQPEMLMDLISHLYVERGPGFEGLKGNELAELLRNQPGHAADVIATWRALGRGVLETLRVYYTDDTLHVRLAALEAGAWLADERASRYLDELASHADPQVRMRVAQALVYLPSSVQGARTLRRLLDDEHTPVRLAAYESLAMINDTAILHRVPIGDGRDIKFIIDEVPSSRPLIYVTQQRFPRIVLFGEDLMPRTPLLARIWENRLMLRVENAEQPMDVFFQHPMQVTATKHKVYPPSILMLAYVLGHKPHKDDPQDGLDLTYGQVVDALYDLIRLNHIDAPIEFRMSPLAQRVAELEKLPAQRPETQSIPDEGLEDPATVPDPMSGHVPDRGLSARPESAPATP